MPSMGCQMAWHEFLTTLMDMLLDSLFTAVFKLSADL